MDKDWKGLEEPELFQLLKDYNESYYEGVPKISDELYDEMVSFYYEKFGKEFETEKGEKLPFEMPTVKKLYPKQVSLSKKLVKTLLETGDSIVLQSKLDGISCLVFKTKKNCISLHQRRGELIIPKKDRKEGESSLRAVASGIVNSQKEDKRLKLIIYKVYQYNKKPLRSSQEEGRLLSELGIKGPLTFYKTINESTDFKKLFEEYYDLVTKEELFEVDGLVVYSSLSLFYDKSIFAFKKNMFTAVVTVEEIEWNLSKKSIFVPVLKFGSVKLNEINCSRVNGYNLEYLRKNGIGIGSVIEIMYAGNVIPVFKQCLKASSVLNIPEDGEESEDARVLDSSGPTSVRPPLPENVESRKRRLHRSCRPRVYIFADKSSDDEEDDGRPQTRRRLDNESEHASRNRASTDGASQSRWK
ncbi:hypothetical protein J6590_105293 [Homalodisca vitripennis]|nr:hypothetical protein J6590_105293 [Homalodisca vitripennis]